jgi:hypothetical protein
MLAKTNGVGAGLMGSIAREQLINIAQDFYWQAARYLTDNLFICSVWCSQASVDDIKDVLMIASITVLKYY